MPVYKQTYRSFDGTVRRRFRWWVIIKQELRILFGVRPFIVLLIMGYMHVCFRILQVVAYDTLASNPNNPLASTLRSVTMLAVNDTMFFDFLRLQASIVFLTTILAGAGMICDDFRNNLMEVYFSKPITWRDYALGKIMTLVLIGLAFTAVPALFLVILHNALAPSWATFQATYWLPPAILLFSLTLVVPCALGVLASSALFSSQRYAAIGVFMVLVGDLVMGQILADVLHQPNYRIIAFPLAIHRVGEELFQQRRPMFDLSWEWSAVFVAAVCLVSMWIVCRKTRRAEVAA